MSEITNLIITTSLSENVDYLSKKFKQYSVNGLPFNIVSMESENLPQNWYGGSKMFNANVFIGAFNYLKIDDLIKYLKEHIDWNSPFSVQLFIKEQNDYKFKLIDIFNE